MKYTHSVMSDSLQPHGLYSPWNSPGQNTGVAAFPFSRDLLNPGIKPRSAALQADSLPAEPLGKPKNTGVGSLSLLQRILLTHRTGFSCIAGEFFTNWAIREALWLVSMKLLCARCVLKQPFLWEELTAVLICITISVGLYRENMKKNSRDRLR